MEARDSEFLKRLEATFRVEADEHLRAIDAGLIELELGPAPERTAAIIETVFREAHSLKGAARSVSRKDIESVCQPMESVQPDRSHTAIMKTLAARPRRLGSSGTRKRVAR